jgi:hypothetical protein
MQNRGKLLVTRFVFLELLPVLEYSKRWFGVVSCLCVSVRTVGKTTSGVARQTVSSLGTDCAGLTRAGTAWRLEFPNWKYQRLRFPDICILAQPAGSGMCRCGSLVCIEMRPTVWAQARAF